ncbi:MAG TPA: hypothetical protein ENO20_14875 [Bacteroides sp.]|nr:hypothetical protein [Bacteroides sp.]
MKRFALFAAAILLVACSEEGSGPGEGEYQFYIEETGGKSYSGKFTNWVVSGGEGSQFAGTIVLGPEEDNKPEDPVGGLTLIVSTGGALPGEVRVGAATLSTSDHAVGTSAEINARLYSFDESLSGGTQSIRAEVASSYVRVDGFSIDLYRTIVSPVEEVQFEEKVTVSGSFTAVAR